MPDITDDDGTVANRRRISVLWLVLFLLAVLAHLLASSKATPNVAVHDYVVVNDRTVFCHAVHGFMHEHWWLFGVVLLLSCALSGLVYVRRLGPVTGGFLLLPVHAFLVLYVAGCAYLVGKFVMW